MKRIIAVVTLLLGAASARATTFPNSYAVNKVRTYDASTGQAGTVHLSYTFTGTTQPSPMCSSGAHHTPQVLVKLLVNGVQTAQATASGTGIGPCVQMNQTLYVSFDLFSDQCSLDILQSGGCTLAEQDSIDCSVVAGQFFEENFLVGIEWAWTRVTATQCIDLGTGSSQCKASYYCQNGSAPPDYQPTRIVAAYPSGSFPPFWLAGAVGFRIPNSYGVPWNFPGADLAGVVPGDGRWKMFLAPAVPWNNSPFTCTLADKDLGSVVPWPF